MQYVSIAKFLMLSVLVLAASHTTAADNPPDVRLYALDCGTLFLEPRAMNWFEDTDAYATTRGVMSVPCFLVRHPKGDFIWDTGLGDDLAGQDIVDLGDGFSARVDTTLQEQLRELGLAPGDIDLVAFSHHHFDHTNNAPLFTDAEFLLNRREMEWTRATPYGVNADSLRIANDTNTRFLDRDHDVFGDGSVRILRVAGHTPGHQVLMLRLANAGTVMLSGDLYHTRENYRLGRVAALNYSRAETLAAFDRVGRLMEKYDARMIVQHDPDDFASLPRFPEFLD